MKTLYTLPLSEPNASIELIGGKGLSLSKLISAGLPVPDGFHITTEAYRYFISSNNLQSKILSFVNDADISKPSALEIISSAIQDLISDAAVPEEITNAIREAYHLLNNTISSLDEPMQFNTEIYLPVAVRSSATAEDLPEASFAGQQDTYLNICGFETLLAAVKKCWASLWTARAIAYRIKNGIDQNSVYLAIVVQKMVKATSAGILFTANPINSSHNEIVVNAAWGLGEAIVSGLVSPDTILVDKATGKIKKYAVAKKTVISVLLKNGTREIPLEKSRQNLRVLNKVQIIKLVELARKIEAFYGSPQDIEWCHAAETFFILQSRPITTLSSAEVPPPPSWKLPKGVYAAMRNNIVELMAGPLSPLFATLGLSAVNNSLPRLMNDSFGMVGIMPQNIIITVNQYAYFNGSISAKAIARLIFDMGKIARMMFTGAVERWTEYGKPRYIETVKKWQKKNWSTYSSVELVQNAKYLTESAIDAYAALVSGVIPAAWMTEALFTKIYNRMIKRRDDPSAPTFLLGFDSMPIRADKSLFDLAEWANQNEALSDYIMRTSTPELITAYDIGSTLGELDAELWTAWCIRFRHYLNEYGFMIYDLDFSCPVPADDFALVLDALKLYMRGEGMNPNERQRETAEKRIQAETALQNRLKGIRLRWFRKYLGMAQKYAPLREDGLAEIGLAYPLIRKILLELGTRLVQHEVITKSDHIFWLTQEELLEATQQMDSGLSPEPLVENVSRRKAEHRAALSIRPPMALPQMKVFGFDLMSLKDKHGRHKKGDFVKGVAASPGQAKGVARILLGPDDFCLMKPGDILVAPITTPAWTPLFAMASAIVTDVGGPLSHGSIVAREYGIPAVLGTGIATRQIKSGQIITVDGYSGIVSLN